MAVVEKVLVKGVMIWIASDDVGDDDGMDADAAVEEAGGLDDERR